MVWILLGTFFIGWVQDYTSAMVSLRNDGKTFGGISFSLISPRARTILSTFRDRIDEVHKLLTDEQLTSFFFVTLPEALPIAVVKRFIGWFRDFGIPVGGVIVNGLIDRSLVTDRTHQFVLNRIASQERYMEEIRSSFPHVRAVVPRLEHEIQGVERIRETFPFLFGV